MLSTSDLWDFRNTFTTAQCKDYIDLMALHQSYSATFTTLVVMLLFQ